MDERERACARSCLAAVEANLAELRGSADWWKLVTAEQHWRFVEFEADVRAYLHALSQ